jgi:ribosomal subunit interface protein
MNVKCTFKKMDPSVELIQHAEDRLSKVEKFEMKPAETAHFIFKPQSRGDFEVELILSGPELAWQASARGDNFFQAVDKVVERVSKQMARKKGKVQHHNGFKKSA